MQSNSNGQKIQDVKVQERGEPKSGTSFSMEWAAETLYHTCDYLDGLYGNGSCQVSLMLDKSLRHITMVFNPRSGDQEDRTCECEEVKR